MPPKKFKKLGKKPTLGNPTDDIGHPIQDFGIAPGAPPELVEEPMTPRWRGLYQTQAPGQELTPFPSPKVQSVDDFHDIRSDEPGSAGLFDNAEDFGNKFGLNTLLSTESPHAIQRRRLLDIINKLHSTGVQHDIDLPQIVVIGSQSVGKSSLIESMSGISLPRDSGTCTRCPMECKLTYSPEPWTCTISLRFTVDNDGRLLRKVIETPFGPPIKDKAEVEGRLRRAQRAILKHPFPAHLILDDLDLGINDTRPLSFSPNCVCLRVSGPQVSDLFFYDLPGIIANVGETGNLRDIELIKGLVNSYISKQRCLILLAVSCETDFENQGAVLMARQHDREGKRSIGVLTKPDRIEDSAATKWLPLIRNEENRLANGWFVVKLPSPTELADKLTWEEARLRETAFFKETEPWSSLPNRITKQLGSGHLTSHLGSCLSKLIAERLPLIQREIDLALNKANHSLALLPAPISRDASAAVTALVFRFCGDLSGSIEGTVQFPGQALGLMQSIRKFHQEFKADILNTAPRFCPWEKKDGPPEAPAIQTAPRTTSQYIWGIAALRPVAIAFAAEQIPWVKEPAFLAQEEHAGSFVNRMGSVFFLDQVMTIAEDSVGRELPGDYPSSVKEEIIKLFVKEWRLPMLNCFRSIEALLRTHVTALIQKYFGEYVHGGLLGKVKFITDLLLQRLESATLSKLESHLATEGRPFTLNAQYFLDFKSNFLNHFRDVRRQSKGQPALLPQLQNGGGYVANSVEYLNYVGFGFPITGPDLARLIPRDPMEAALEIMSTVRAYFQVAYKRFLDAVPLAIDAEFISAFDSKIREDLILGLNVGSQEQCQMWLSEEPSILAQRRELGATRQRLKDAKQELASFGSW